MEKKKEYLRKKFGKIRTNFPQKERQRLSRIIKKKLFGLDEFKNAKIVMFFVSFNSEVNTLPMIEKAIGLKKRVVVPLVVRRMKSLVAVEIFSPKKDLCPGVYGIFEPVNRENIVGPREIDLILVPGVIFDMCGYRIGYGAGYYDRWLRHFDMNRRVGVAFSFQVVKKIPHKKYDLSVNKIVTEREVIETCRKN